MSEQVNALEVLVLESERGAAALAIDDLAGAGHHVYRCHEPGESGFPCKALTDRSSCPLEHAAIDVAVTVRGRARSHPSESEDGVSCAIKRHVPLVVTGRTALHPYDGFAAATTDLDTLVETVERVAADDLPGHVEAVRSAMRQFAAVHSLDADAVAVSVKRQYGTLKVTLSLDGDLPRRSTDMAAVRAVGAIRALDPDAGGIDVAIDHR